MTARNLFMKFLIDEDLPRSISSLLQRYGHEAIDVRDIGLGGTEDSVIASYAKDNGLCLISGDFGFSDIRNYPPAEYNGLVILTAQGNATAAGLLDLLESLLKQDGILADIRGRLLIVERNRIRIRK